MLSSPKHVPEQKQVSLTSLMSLTEEGGAVGGGSVAPPVTSNTSPMNPYLSVLGNKGVMTAFVGFLNAMQVRGRGFDQRV